MWPPKLHISRSLAPGTAGSCSVFPPVSIATARGDPSIGWGRLPILTAAGIAVETVVEEEVEFGVSWGSGVSIFFDSDVE